jgi:hypothetical protein
MRGQAGIKDEMIGRHLAFILLALAAPAAAQPISVGTYGQWGAFQKDGPRNCYAIALPQREPRAQEAKPFASVSYWPQRKLRGQVHIRLSREKRAGSAVLLRIDDRSFQLLAGKADAWALNAAADREIVAAMRTGVEMRVETRAGNGASVVDSYSLRGAASAIDAAAIACSR